MTSYISDIGLRSDGRRPHEVRQIECKLSNTANADGSASFQLGSTHVLASVFGPRNPQTKAARGNSTNATIYCKVNSAEFSQSEHRNKERFYRRDTLLSDLITQTFESVIITQLYPRSSIDIYIDILSNDGGATSAAINAVSLACIDAGIAMREYVVACSAGYVNSSGVHLTSNMSDTKNNLNNVTCVVDLNFTERGASREAMRIDISNAPMQQLSKKQSNSGDDSANKDIKMTSASEVESKSNESPIIIMTDNNDDDDDADNDGTNSGMCAGQIMVAMMPVSGKIITMEMQSMIPLKALQRLINYSKRGIKVMHQQMTKSVKQHSFELLQHRGFLSV